MHPISQIIYNECLLCTFCAWLISQLLKGCFFGLRYHDWSLKSFLGSGGMPSSHTAAVVACTLMIGFREGFASSCFAISAIFALIVMHDAAGIRREAGKQSKVIKELLNITMPDGKSLISEDLKERIGHSPLEVIMGAMVGILCCLVALIL